MAIRLIERSRTALPDLAEAETLLIKGYLKTGDFDAAVDAGERAVKEGSSDIKREVLPTYADALILNGLFSDALAALREFVTIVGPFSDEELGATYKHIETIESGRGPELREQLFSKYDLPPVPLPEARVPLPPVVEDIGHKRAKLIHRFPGAFGQSAGPFEPKVQPPFHVYLSYHFKDGPLVRRIAERLMAAGVRVWFFEYLTPPADYHRLARVMLEGIEQCACALLFTSQDYANSVWCEQDAIWIKQRFRSHPDRIFEVTLDPPFSVRTAFQLPANCEMVKWRRPASIETEKESVDILMAALQPYTRVAAPRGPAWPWNTETAAYRARCAPVRIDTCGLRLDKWEIDAKSSGDQVRFIGQGEHPLTLDLRFSFALSQSDIDNIFPTQTDGMDDRRVYQRFVAFAERHVRDWTPLWAKLRQGGIHLAWANGRPQFAFTYCTGRAWVRRYFVILTDPALPRPVEVVFTFGVAGTPEQAGPFLLEAGRMDRIVQSTSLLFLKEFRQLRAASERLESGALDRAVTDFQAILANDQEWAQVWYGLLQAHLRRKDWSEACSVGWKARGVVPDADPWKARILFCLADALVLAGNARDARMVLMDCLPLASKDPSIEAGAIQMRIAALESSQAELLQSEMVQRLESGGFVGIQERVVPVDQNWGASGQTVVGGLQRSPEFSKDSPAVRPMPATLPKIRRALGAAAALCVPAILVAVSFIRNRHGTLLNDPEGRHLFGLLLAGITALLAGYNTLGFVQNRHYQEGAPVPFLGLTTVVNVLALAATLAMFLWGAV